MLNSFLLVSCREMSRLGLKNTILEVVLYPHGHLEELEKQSQRTLKRKRERTEVENKECKSFEVKGKIDEESRTKQRRGEEV